MSYASGNKKQMRGDLKKMVVSFDNRANRSCIRKDLTLHKHKYLWRECQKESVIIEAWRTFRRGKTKRADVVKIEADFDKYVRKMKKQLSYTRPLDSFKSSKERGLAKIYMFTPQYHSPRIITEYNKEREIYCPDTWEQWVHHIVILAIQKIIMKYIHPNSCGSLPNRGGIYGKKKIENALKVNNVNYFIKGDIRHFFRHCSIDNLIEVLRKYIDDEWYFFLIRRVYLHYGWLVLGFYPSQWFSNFQLVNFDWYVESLNPILYLRYVDDFVICGSDKKELHCILGKIKHYLGTYHRLRLKNNYQVIKFKHKGRGRYIDIMGYVFRDSETVIRKKNFLKVKRMAKKLSKIDSISVHQARSFLSRVGWFRHSNTQYAWITYVQPCVSLASLKEIVSKHDRRLNHDRVENRNNDKIPTAV